MFQLSSSGKIRLEKTSISGFLCVKNFEARHFRNSDFLNAKIGYKLSYTYQSICGEGMSFLSEA